jgi:hypothetical protein
MSKSLERILAALLDRLKSIAFNEIRLDALREAGEFVSWFEIIYVKENEDGSKSLHAFTSMK